MLSDEQRQTLRLALDPLMPLPKRLVLEVFEALFELDPGLRETFAGDLEPQAAQLALALSGGIVHLIDDGAVAESARQLGVRLRRQGVIERDYDTLGRALTSVFARRLGGDFSEAGRAAWEEAWDLLATAMQKAAVAASVVAVEA